MVKCVAGTLAKIGCELRTVVEFKLCWQQYHWGNRPKTLLSSCGGRRFKRHGGTNEGLYRSKIRQRASRCGKWRRNADRVSRTSDTLLLIHNSVKSPCCEIRLTNAENGGQMKSHVKLISVNSHGIRRPHFKPNTRLRMWANFDGFPIWLITIWVQKRKKGNICNFCREL